MEVRVCAGVRMYVCMCVYAYPLLGEPHQDPEAQRYEAALAFLVHPATFVETLRMAPS